MTIVEDFGSHFLRDDTEIRRNADITPHEAYSLFRREPYGRVEVLAGPKEWAIAEARKLVDKA